MNLLEIILILLGLIFFILTLYVIVKSVVNESISNLKKNDIAKTTQFLESIQETIKYDREKFVNFNRDFFNEQLVRFQKLLAIEKDEPTETSNPVEIQYLYDKISHCKSELDKLIEGE